MEEISQIENPKKKRIKVILKIILIFFSVLFFFISCLVGLLFFYEDEVKLAIIKELNTHLKVEIKINPKNINLTIIKSFPDCSIEFKNMLILEALKIKNRDTLLFTNQLNLFFNIKNLWNKKYDIKKIKIKDAVLKLQVLKNGEKNYIFWGQDTTKLKQKNDSVNFNLKFINIKNCRVMYNDRSQSSKTDLKIEDLNLNGNFSEFKYQLKTDGKLLINQISNEKTVFLSQKKCNFYFDLNVSDSSYTFNKSIIELNELSIKLSGDFVYGKSFKDLNLKFITQEMNISSFLSLVPNNFNDKIKDYESSGNFYSKGIIKYENINSYSIENEFGIKYGEIKYKPTSTKAININIEGKFNYSNSSSSLSLKNIYFNLKNDEIKGSALINNFNKPYVKLDLISSIHLENIKSFFPIDTLDKLQGSLKIKTTVEGLYIDLKDKILSTNVKLELEATIKDLELKFKNDEKSYSVKNCFFISKNRQLQVSDLKLIRGTSDILINGNLPGIFNYFLDNDKPLIIEGDLLSNNFNLEDFISNNNALNTNDNPIIPTNIDFKLNASILNFSYSKFKAQNLSGKILIKNKKMIVEKLNISTLKGQAEIDLYADNSNKNLNVVLHSKFKNINISDLFFQFNNFSQNTLTDNNIKGVASANIDFYGEWNSKLEPDYNSIKSTFDLTIEQGELIDFKPLLCLSKFVDIKDLQRIKFASLQSKIEINSKLLKIPKTVLTNSALNFDFYGTHNFNNDIEYHFQLLINDFLFRKRKNNDDEFQIIDNENKRKAYILMTGNLYDPKIKFDRKGFQQKIKDDIKEEKQNIKQLLKDEFGLFKKDTSIKKTKKEALIFELEKQKNNINNTLSPKKNEDDDDF